MAAEKERDPGSSSAEIGKYLDILAKDPNSRVFAPLAEAYRKAGLLDDAVETALEGLKVHPNYLGGRVALGRAYFEKRQYAEAAAELQKVARSAPDNIIAHKVLGQIASRQNDLPAAEKAFKMVLLLDPRDQEAQQFVANLAGKVTAAPSPPQPQPVSPPLPAPPGAAPLPFEELQAFEEIDSQPDDIFAGRPPVPDGGTELEDVSRGLPKADSGRAASPPLPAPGPVFGLASESVFELASEPAPERVPEPASGPVAEAEADDSPFEVFTRERGPKAAAATVKAERAVAMGPRELAIETTAYTPPDAFTADGVAAPLPGPGEDLRRIDLTQEIDFGSGPDASPSLQAPVSELELEPAAEPALEVKPEREPELVQELAFEIDSEPELESEPAQELKAELEPELEPELEFEIDSEPGPEAELKREPEPDLGPELELEAAPEPEPEPEPELEKEPEFEIEPEPGPEAELKTELEPDLGPELELETAPEPELVTELEPELVTGTGSGPEMDLEVDLESDLEPEVSAPPSVEPAPQVRPEPPEEEYGDISPEEEPAAADVGRGLFDTETLASIYTSQGFYGRAAEIYQRLIVQRPDDAGLRGKLEGVLAREREESGIEEPVTAAAAEVAPFPPPAPLAPAGPPPAGAMPVGADQTISRLNALLAAFKGGRPR